MSQEVIVYSTQYCPHCTRAKNLLKSKNIEFKEVDLTNDEKQREALRTQTGWMTVPMIFIGDEFIGGADDLFALDEDGQLEAKVNS